LKFQILTALSMVMSVSSNVALSSSETSVSI
jgi:hypothetical protein